MGMFGTCCSSFVRINAGTSKRDALIPESSDDIPTVRVGNKLLCRTDQLSSCFVQRYIYTCNKLASFRLCMLSRPVGGFRSYI